MSKKRTVGIVGQGFVGSAIREGLQDSYDIATYDLDPGKRNCNSLEGLVDKAQFIFICLPTPMESDGRCHLGIIRDVIFKVDEVCHQKGYSDRICILKSTIPPGSTDSIQGDCQSVALVFSPEFLTEANSYDDFKNQTRIIIGGPRPASSKVKTMFRRAFPRIPIVKTSTKHAEMVKYFINCFLATKVSFANEMYQVCEAIGIDYDKVIEYAMYDDRLGKSHFSVPGPDGSFGYGGHCFPKDLSAMIKHASDYHINTNVLTAVRSKNDEVRDDRDWEGMQGRAVI